MKLKNTILPGAVLAAAMISSHAYSNEWPDLPIGFKNGVFAQHSGTALVGLGSAGDALFAMNTTATDKSWTKLAPFPGPSTNGAAAALAGDKLYVFSGSGKPNPTDASPIIFDTAYAYDTVNDRWEKLDTKVPVGLLGATAYAINDDVIAFFGGYNKALFDQYLNDVLTTDKEAEPDKWQGIVDDYMGMPPADYKWNTKVLTYTISTNSWSDLGENPFPPNTGSALVANEDGILLINGEIKPGLRTPKVKHVTFETNNTNWTEWPQIPALVGSDLQEGLASPFAGNSNGAIIVAGGANFHGARARSFAEDWFTHRGYPKAFNSDIYVYENGGWKIVNSLPHGLAYGASFEVNNGVLIVGGEDSDRSGRTETYLLKWDGASVTITD